MKKNRQALPSGMWLKRSAVAGSLVAVALVAPVVATQAGTGPNRSDADSHVGLLRGNAEGLGSFGRGELSSPGYKQMMRVDPANAQKADTGSSPWKVWLAATGENACMYFTLPGSSVASVACGPASEVAGGRMAITHTGSGDHPSVTVIGIVPDGISSVAVSTHGGVESASVKDNVFVATTDDTAKSYSYDAPNGRHTVPIRVDK
jgi:hypothetical protein